MFAVIGGEVRTAPLTNYVLPGITRGFVLELAQAQGLRGREAPVFLDELRRADEIFLAGTTTEVLGVVQLDGKPVSGGRPGKITSRLREAFCSFSQENSE
jgi:D-alanine transaminase